MKDRIGDSRESTALRQEWEQRAESFGAQPRAVLLRGLPSSINAGIDLWHRELLQFFLEDTKSNVVLDIGCGYGRLAQHARAAGAETVVGLDFSIPFCRRFTPAHGPSICADLAQLPFGSAAFHAAYSVTSLMYLDVERAAAAVMELDRVLKPGARVLLVEAGAEFTSLARTIFRRKTGQQLARPGFTASEFAQFVPASWLRVGHGGNGWFTLAMPILVLCARAGIPTAGIMKWARRLDRPDRVRRWNTPLSLHRWAVFETPRAPGSPP